MKILWFSVTPSQFVAFNNGHNGGGWIASLEELVSKEVDVELGIAFEYPFCESKRRQNNVIYYPIDTAVSKFKKISKFFNPLEFEKKFIIPKCLEIISDFKPDIIHIFGSENQFGLLTFYTKIPIIIHMQGSLPPCYNARFPITINFKDILLSTHYTITKKLSEFRNLNIFRLRAQREINILKQTKYFFGRTHWDKSIIRIFNPNAEYFYCSEVLRNTFYDGKEWNFRNQKRLIIVSTISTPLYKGLDVVLKTAKILKEECHLNFIWKIIGIKQAPFIEAHFNIRAIDVSVEMLGCLSAEDVKEELLKAHFYVHPSYIDNSPNSVCEAQILGVPVICCNVGGVSSLIDDNVTGFLVPANDPFKIADIIYTNAIDKDKLNKISKQEIIVAQKRHSKKQIIRDLFFAYRSILNQSNHNMLNM